jgi:hypothetical protein
VASLALPGDLLSNRLDRPVQFSLIDRVHKSERMDRAGPLLILFGMATTAIFRRTELNRRLVPFQQGRIIGIELVVHVKDPRSGESRSSKRNQHYDQKPDYSPFVLHGNLLFVIRILN